MNEHEDCVMPSVTVDSTALDEMVTGRLGLRAGKTEGVLVERNEGEDMMVDVVGADVVDGDHGRTGVELDGKTGSVGLVEESMQKETETHDLDVDMKNVAVAGADVCHASVGSSVLTFEKVEVSVNEEGLKRSVEVSKDVLQGSHENACVSDDDAQKSGTSVRDSKMDFESSKGEPQVGGDVSVKDSKELTARGSIKEVMEQHVESVEDVASGDCVMDKARREAVILDSSKVAESFTTAASLGSQEVDMVIVEEGFAGKDEAEDGVSVDPSLVCANNQNSSTELVNAGEIVERSKEESLHQTIVVITDDAQGNKNVESLSREPRFVGENDSIDREEESERGLSEEVMEQPRECAQQVADGDCVGNEKIEKEYEVVDSFKISEPSTTTNLGSEDVDVVGVEGGLASKDEAQDGVSVDPSLVRPDDKSLLTKVVNSATGEGDVNAQAENLDQQVEVDKLRKRESFHPTIEVITNNAQKPENDTGVGDSKSAIGPSSGEPQFGGGTAVIDREETERGLTKDEEIMEQPTESVQEVTHDGVMDEVTGKVDEVLDSSKIPQLLTTANLGPDEVLTRKIETQDSETVDPRLACPDNQSLSTEVVNAGKGEGAVHVNAETSNQQAEVNTMSKDESMHPKIEVTLRTEADEVAVCTEVDEGTTTSEVPDCEIQVTSAGGMGNLVESQRLKAGIDSSRPYVATCTEPEFSINQTTCATATKDTEIASKGENHKVSVDDQVLKAEAVSRGSIIDADVCAKPSNYQFLFNSGNEVPAEHIKIAKSTIEVPSTSEMNGFQVSADAFEEVNSVTPCADVAKHRVLPEDSEFSYEEAHMERGEDAGMDIDEVLGWKDEMPGIDVLSGSAGHPEKDQHYNINANSEGDEKQGLPKSSCEPILVGQKEEKSQQSIVYECPVPVEVPLYDALDESRSSLCEDENLKVETNSVEDGESVQEEEQKADRQSTNLPRVDELVNEEPSARAPLDTVSSENHCLEGHVNEVKDSSSADKEDHSLPLEGNNSKLVENSACLRACFDERGDNEFTEVGVEEHGGIREQTDLCREQKAEALDHGSEAEWSTGNEVTRPLENESSFSLHQSRYFRTPEKHGQFSINDLVWGNIRSHPWWPGQIVDPSDASEKAMKYHKKDCFLVAYFGDRTFAWNDSAVLKPFRAIFSQMEKLGNSESFKNAVRCALEEVSRRVELGLACSCTPKDIYEKIEYQIVENGGIKQKSNRRHGTDESAGVGSFEPDRLVDYVRLLAQFPGEGDKMELAIAKAQLSAYGHYKGYRQLAEIQICGDISEDASMLCEGVELVNKYGAKMYERRDVPGENDASENLGNSLMDSAYPNKDRSLSGLTDDAPYSGDGDEGAEGGNITSNLVSPGSRKRKAHDSISVDSVKRPSLCPDKVPTALLSTPKPSFKVGECIQRVASQLTGPPSVLKSNSDARVEHGPHSDQLVGSAFSLQIPENSQRGRMIVKGEQSSVAEMLSQLHLAAQDPMKGYSFSNTIIPFFCDRRAAVLSKSIRKSSSVGGPVEGPVSARKRKVSNENDPEEFEFEFEFDDVNDSYWTDRIVHNHSEEQLSQDSPNGGLAYHVVAYEEEKPAKASRRSNKKRFMSSNREIGMKEQSELVERRLQNLATEVVLKFTEGIYFPSEIHLNKMFRRFGPLMESETKVDRQSGRARVVFKRCSDAEVAHSSAGKFNIFGSINVNYELNYTPLISYKPLPLSPSLDPMDAS